MNIEFIPLFIGGIEVIAIVAILLLLFGAKRIPKVARSIGEASVEFKRGRSEDDESE